jgi:uncharacterized membrane protein
MESSVTPTLPLEPLPRRWLWPLLLAYPVLLVAGLLTRREIFPLLAVMVLVTAVLLPRLLRRRMTPWLVWFTAQGLLLTSAWLGLADVLLNAVPALINALLAWWFGRTLLTSRPLVARCIVAIEGAARLRERGVARYARQLTAFWAALIAANALLLAVLLLCAAPSGVLARFGVTPPLRIEGWWAAAWLHVGGYVVVVAAFALEYPYRRWRLRHLQHLSLPQMLLRLAVNWPRLLRGEGAGP